MKKALKIIFIILLLFALYVFTSLSPIFYSTPATMKNNNFTITGHRGAGNLAPENTLSAIKEGLKYNVDRIEVDVHQTEDGKVVIMHDKTIDRTTNGKGKIKDFTYKELLKFDAGSWFSDKFKGEKIPLLEEAMKLIDGKAKFVIELKDGDEYYPDIVEHVIDIIKKYNATDWCIIHSFKTGILEQVHQLDPEIELHKLFIGKLSLLPVYVSAGFAPEYYSFEKHPYITEYSINYLFANKSIINAIHKRGKKVNVWTIDNFEKFQKLKNLGIDGFITNSPNIINRD
ncbi:MAG: glycerophosphodiester phosphodiesterase [Bacteroidetes bacterium]|nr:MAG: glycerophosphodiester phosphodiesterase [Bacteroidota bacterium]